MSLKDEKFRKKNPTNCSSKYWIGKGMRENILDVFKVLGQHKPKHTEKINVQNETSMKMVDL